MCIVEKENCWLALMNNQVTYCFCKLILEEKKTTYLRCKHR
uniref:Uncharacterized protein n=1 Tax=Arundo donax TaxID=35708 RepID=A0A0A9EG96_ARUDO